MLTMLHIMQFTIILSYMITPCAVSYFMTDLAPCSVIWFTSIVLVPSVAISLLTTLRPKYCFLNQYHCIIRVNSNEMFFVLLGGAKQISISIVLMLSPTPRKPTSDQHSLNQFHLTLSEGGWYYNHLIFLTAYNVF